jgi:HEAT repeat protein
MTTKTNDKKFQEALHHLVSDESPKLHLLHQLSHPSKTSLAAFTEIWPNLSPERRETIIAKLVEINEDDFSVNFLPLFIFGLDDESPQVQAACINGMWEVQDSVFVPIFSHLMHTSPSQLVRLAAADALGRFIYWGELEEVSEEALLVAEQALLKTIKNSQEEPDVVRQAVEALGYSSQNNVLDIIAWAYDQDDELMQISAMRAMSRNLNERWKGIILQELNSDDNEMRFEAAHAAGELQMSEAVEKLIALINHDPDSEIKANAIWALGQIGGTTAQHTLEDIIETGDDSMLSLIELAEEALDELLLYSGQFELLNTSLNELDLVDDDFEDDYAETFPPTPGDYMKFPFKINPDNLN